MSLFERLSNPSSLKSQARETGVPAPILKKVYDRGVKDAKATAPEADKDAWGKARVDAFVRGGVDRAKDADLWQKYHQEPQAEALADETTTGIFLPLPESLSHYFPKKEEDKTPPHVTLLYVGAITPEQEEILVRAVREAADRWPPFRADLTRYDEFVNDKGQTIAHMIPAAAICLSAQNEIYRGLGHLHADLYSAVEDAGIPVEHNYGGEKLGSYDDRATAFKPHATLAYVPAGEKYAGPTPTGSWHANEIEVWGHGKHRIPLGLKAANVSLPPVSNYEPPEDEIDNTPTVELRIESVQVTAKGVQAPTVQPQPQPPENPFIAVLAKVANQIAEAPKKPEVKQSEELPVEPSQAAELGKADTESPSPVVETRPGPPWLPVRMFESFGFFEGSILDYGGVEDHPYARYNVLSEDHDVVNRHWKTIVCGHLHEQTPFGRTSTLLALRGLLKRDGKALVALPVNQPVEEWETLFSRFFSTKRLSMKGAVAWQLTPTSEFTEQGKPELLPIPPPPPPPPVQLPPINIGPVILRIPEREVQVQVQAPINFTVPEQPAPQVNIAAGAVKVDVHTPPPTKKRVTMVKDGNGRVTGELEVVEETSPKLPVFPSVEEILSDEEPSANIKD